MITLTNTETLKTLNHQVQQQAHVLATIQRSMAVIEFDLNGIVLHANDNFLSALGGYSLTEVVGQHHRIFVDKLESESPAYQQFWAKLARGEFVAERFKRIGKNKEVVWIQASYNPVLDDTGRPYKVIKFATVVTADVVKENEVSAKMTAINRSMAVIEFDLQGNILTANENFLTTMGYVLSEIVGKHHSIFVDKSEYQSASYQQFWSKLAAGQLMAGTFKRKSKSQSDVWIEASYNPVLDAEGKVYKIIKFAADVTEQETRKLALSMAVKDASEVLLALADGDLTKQMPSGVYKGELHDLKNALNYTIDSFKRIVAETRESADVVTHAAAQVSMEQQIYRRVCKSRQRH